MKRMSPASRVSNKVVSTSCNLVATKCTRSASCGFNRECSSAGYGSMKVQSISQLKYNSFTSRIRHDECPEPASMIRRGRNSRSMQKRMIASHQEYDGLLKANQ